MITLGLCYFFHYTVVTPTTLRGKTLKDSSLVNPKPLLTQTSTDVLWLAILSEVLLGLKQFSSFFSKLTSDAFCNCQGSHGRKELITASFWGGGSQACFSWEAGLISCMHDGAEEPFCHSSGSYLTSMSTAEVDYRLRCAFLSCQLPRHLC